MAFSMTRFKRKPGNTRLATIGQLVKDLWRDDLLMIINQ